LGCKSSFVEDGLLSANFTGSRANKTTVLFGPNIEAPCELTKLFLYERIIIDESFRMVEILALKMGKVFENSSTETVLSKKGGKEAVAPALIDTPTSPATDPPNLVSTSPSDTIG
jgi:hypothetical protein